MSGKSNKTPILTVVVLAVVAGVFYALHTLRKAAPSDEPPGVAIDPETDPAGAAEAFDLAAYERRVAGLKEAGEFDYEAHEEAMLQVGPAAVAADEALRAARHELVKYEAEQMRATPEREAWATEIENLYAEATELSGRQMKLMEEDEEWQRLSKVLATNHLIAAGVRQEVYKQLGESRAAMQDADAPPPGKPTPEQEAAVERLRAAAGVADAAKREFDAYQLGMRTSEGPIKEFEVARSNLMARASARQAELKASFQDDPGWKELQQKIEQAEAERRQARGRVANLIRIRMHTESELKHPEVEGAARQQESEP